MLPRLTPVASTPFPSHWAQADSREKLPSVMLPSGGAQALTRAQRSTNSPPGSICPLSFRKSRGWNPHLRPCSQGGLDRLPCIGWGQKITDTARVSLVWGSPAPQLSCLQRCLGHQAAPPTFPSSTGRVLLRTGEGET